MSQPHWIIVTLLGAIVGFALPYIAKAVQYVVRRLGRATIEGLWYSYHVSNRAGQLVVEPAMWKVHKGYASEFVVSSSRQASEKPLYKGRVSAERNFWLIQLKGVKHQEEVSIRVLNPIPTQDALTWGLCMSLDFQGNPIAGPVLLSRNEFSPEDALAAMLRRTTVHSAMGLITSRLESC